MRRFLKAKPSACRACQSCVFACAIAHNLPSGLRFGRLSIHHTFMIPDSIHVVICRHCPRPKCIEECPAGAITQDEEGLVHIDPDTCICCGKCAENCPFGAITVLSDLGCSIKCDLCSARDKGPACVEVCPVNAITLVEKEAK